MANLAPTLGLASVGADVTIHDGARVVDPGAISIGDSVIIDDFVFLYAGADGSIRIGSFVHIASFVSVTGGGVLELGDFVGLSSGTRVFTGDDDYAGGCLTGPTVPYPYRVPVRSSIKIGKHAIIGANSVILPGVTIGEGASVGAGSLVREDLPPWTVSVGSPSRVIRDRPSEKILQLERDLRQELYDQKGRYIPKDRRPTAQKVPPTIP